MEPEIARRCKVCGAAVRNHAEFCPQCGASINTEASHPFSTEDASKVQLNQTMEGVEPESPMPAVTPSDTAPVSDLAATSEAVAVSEDGVVAPVEEIVPTSPVMITDERVDGDGAAVESVVAASATPTTTATAPTRRHRVKVAALDAVEGKIAPRVEKLRHASTIVLDEAADDPGLRFVLIAALLIILSLILVLLSQFLG
jgi:hypothetical protein